MTANGWLQIFFLLLVVLLITKPLGGFMARVFGRERTWLDPVMRPVERILYKLTGVDENHEMEWKEYALALLLFSGVSMILLYVLQRVQQWTFLPWNPQKLAGVPQALAFNTAASFTTNTNWQSYVPETTMSYLTQMVGLAYHNWVSAAAGMALAMAFIRGIARREQKKFTSRLRRASFGSTRKGRRISMRSSSCTGVSNVTGRPKIATV